MNAPSNSSSDLHRVEQELAELTGERYTLNAHLQWIDTRIDLLQKTLKHLHEQEA